MTPEEMTLQMATNLGFVAALDQSGGSTPNTLQRYGVEKWHSEEEMFSIIHEMRKRIITSPTFNGSQIIGTILFKKTLESEVEGQPTAKYLINNRKIVPFLKIDNGLADENNGVRLMKPIPELNDILELAIAHGVFGTKMRSIINAANRDGINENVSQQFDLARRILDKGLVPIVEPEITIGIEDKEQAEILLLGNLIFQLNELPRSHKVILKLSLPELPNLYAPLANHSHILRIVALSGGYSLKDATTRLSQNRGMIASFSRALTEGLLHSQSEELFNRTLASNIEQIYDASIGP